MAQFWGRGMNYRVTLVPCCKGGEEVTLFLVLFFISNTSVIIIASTTKMTAETLTPTERYRTFLFSDTQRVVDVEGDAVRSFVRTIPVGAGKLMEVPSAAVET